LQDEPEKRNCGNILDYRELDNDTQYTQGEPRPDDIAVSRHGYSGCSGEGEHRFRKEAERRSGAKGEQQSERSDAGMVIVE